MKIFAAGSAKTEDVAINARSVNFTDDQGRVIFSVRPGQDGRSIEVRGVETVFIDGVAFGSRLAIAPEASNVVVVQARPYDEK